jgi:hypothetical protein
MGMATWGVFLGHFTWRHSAAKSRTYTEVAKLQMCHFVEYNVSGVLECTSFGVIKSADLF